MYLEWLSFLYSPVISILKLIYSKFEKPDPLRVLKHRQNIKFEFESHFRQKNKYGNRGEAIIRDINRLDNYPDIEEKGPSSWFKVEIKDLYHHGLEVFMDFGEYIAWNDSIERWEFSDEANENKVFAYPLGRIPFDRIMDIDWHGDGYYRDPHIYCRFDGKKLYEDIVYYYKEGSGEYEYMRQAEGLKRPTRKKIFGLL